MAGLRCCLQANSSICKSKKGMIATAIIEQATMPAMIATSFYLQKQEMPDSSLPRRRVDKSRHIFSPFLEIDLFLLSIIF